MVVTELTHDVMSIVTVANVVTTSRADEELEGEVGVEEEVRSVEVDVLVLGPGAEVVPAEVDEELVGGIGFDEEVLVVANVVDSAEIVVPGSGIEVALMERDDGLVEVTRVGGGNALPNVGDAPVDTAKLMRVLCTPELVQEEIAVSGGVGSQLVTSVSFTAAMRRSLSTGESLESLLLRAGSG